MENRPASLSRPPNSLLRFPRDSKSAQDLAAMASARVTKPNSTELKRDYLFRQPDLRLPRSSKSAHNLAAVAAKSSVCSQKPLGSHTNSEKCPNNDLINMKQFPRNATSVQNLSMDFKATGVRKSCSFTNLKPVMGESKRKLNEEEALDNPGVTRPKLMANFVDPNPKLPHLVSDCEKVLESLNAKAERSSILLEETLGSFLFEQVDTDLLDIRLDISGASGN